jgi:hypothetical protein
MTWEVVVVEEVEEEEEEEEDIGHVVCSVGATGSVRSVRGEEGRRGGASRIVWLQNRRILSFLCPLNKFLGIMTSVATKDADDEQYSLGADFKGRF